MQIKANIAVTFNDSHSFYWWLCIKFLPQFGENLMHYFPAIVPHRFSNVKLVHVFSSPWCIFQLEWELSSIHFIYYYVNNIRRMDMDFFSCSTHNYTLHIYNMCNASIQLNQSRCQVIWWRFGFMLPDINIKFNLRWVFYRCDIKKK